MAYSTDQLNHSIILDIRKIPSFYYPSSLYQQFHENLKIFQNTQQEEIGYQVSIDEDLYWDIIGNERDIRNIATNVDDMIKMFNICHYWGFPYFPWLVLKSYIELTTNEKIRCLTLLNNSRILAQNFIKLTIHKLKFLGQRLIGKYDGIWFIIACQNGYLDIVQFMIETDIYPNMLYDTINEYEKNGFLEACSHGHLQIVNYLIDNEICPYVDLEAVCKFDCNGFMYACLNGHLTIVRYLIENNKQPFRRLDMYSKDHSTGLLYACERNHLPIVRYLMENTFCRPKIATKNKLGFTPFTIALHQGHFKIVKYLVELYDPVYLQNLLKHFTPPKYFNINGYLQCKVFLKEKGFEFID